MLINFDSLKTFYSALKQKMKNFRGNWEQNDPSADDYIKNRPFYSEIKATEIFQSTLTFISGFNEIEISLSLVEGQTYTVLWNGEKYNCLAKKDNYNYIYIGNQNLAKNNGWEFPESVTSNEPFFMFIPFVGYLVILLEKEGEYEISILESSETIHQIDKKFVPIPDGIVTEDDVAEMLGSGFSQLADVAFTGNYNDLNNKPVIPEIPSDTVRAGISQSFTEAQKTQARTNIDAVTKNDILPSGAQTFYKTWNGITENLDFFEFEGYKYCKISDRVINLSDIIKYSIFDEDGDKLILFNGYPYSGTNCYRLPGVIVVLEGGQCSLAPNPSIPNKIISFTAPSSGIYFEYLYNPPNNNRFISALEFTYNANMLDEKYIPDTIARMPDILVTTNSKVDKAEIGEYIKDKITSPATAEVGQLLVVKAVDENGRPTEWEAAARTLGTPTLLGDVNGDGVVTKEDADLIARFLTGQLGPDETFIAANADANGNGRIDAADATLIAKIAEGEMVTLTQEEYEEKLASGKVIETTYYYIYEDVNEE